MSSYAEYEQLSNDELLAELQRLKTSTVRLEGLDRKDVEALQMALKASEESLARTESLMSVLNERRREAQNRLSETQNEYMDFLGELAGNREAAGEILHEIYREVDLEPGSAKYFVQQGHILWKQGKRERALLFFNKGLPEHREEIWSNDDAITAMNRGNLQLELGNVEEGLKDLQLAAEINPNLPIIPLWTMSSLVQEAMLNAYLRQGAIEPEA